MKTGRLKLSDCVFPSGARGTLHVGNVESTIVIEECIDGEWRESLHYIDPTPNMIREINEMMATPDRFRIKLIEIHNNDDDTNPAADA